MKRRKVRPSELSSEQMELIAKSGSEKWFQDEVGPYTVIPVVE